jgi:hypothetical protein
LIIPGGHVAGGAATTADALGPTLARARERRDRILSANCEDEDAPSQQRSRDDNRRAQPEKECERRARRRSGLTGQSRRADGRTAVVLRSATTSDAKRHAHRRLRDLRRRGRRPELRARA